MNVKPVWRLNEKDGRDEMFVPRCAKCGDYREPLHVHFFFIGRYCRNCIQYILYGDHRTIERINEKGFKR